MCIRTGTPTEPAQLSGVARPIETRAGTGFLTAGWVACGTNQKFAADTNLPRAIAGDDGV
jgi:hypothetical protein